MKQYVRSKLEEEKEKKVIEELVANNHVQVPEDFNVPEVSEEQIKEMMQKQQQMSMPPPGAGGDEAGDDQSADRPAANTGTAGAEPKKK